MKAKKYRFPVLFVGAGVSYPSGLPLAIEIKNLLLEESCGGTSDLETLHQEMRISWEKKLKGVMLESVIEIFTRHCPSKEKELASIFLGARPSHYHRAIAELLAGGHIAGAITTNFDDAIERAYSEHSERIEGALSLQVVVDEADSAGQREHERPRLIKIHGCASRPESMALIVSRVGKGLLAWQQEELRLLASRPFIVIGYSDRDKDITPVLSTLNNQWAWICHNVIPIEEQIPPGSLLEGMLAGRKRTLFFTDADVAITKFATSLTSNDYPIQPRVETKSWRRNVATVVQNIDIGSRHLIVGDIAYELFGDWESAETAYTCPTAVSRVVRAELSLKLNRVYGDRWKLSDMEASLKAIHSEIGSADDLPDRIKAMLAKNWASFHYKSAVRLSEKAEKRFAEEEKYWESAGDRSAAASARLNRAVVLQKRGRYKAAQPAYLSAIETIRSEGALSLLAKALMNHGSLLRMTGENEEALGNYEEASELFFMLGEPLWSARLKVNIGIALYELERLSEAESELSAAKEVLMRFKDEYWLRNARMALGDVREALQGTRE